MPTVPQFFRHFYPKIRSRVSLRTLGNNTSSDESGLYTKQSDRVRAGSKGVTNDCIDLDSERHQLKTCNAFSHGTRVSTDELSATSVSQ